jgi:hypothetical protein
MPDAFSADEMEADSIRYGNRTILLVPLSSGNLAIFGRDFQLHTILTDAPTTAELQRLSEELNTKLAQRLRLDAELRFYGEPTPRQQARDLRQSVRRRTDPNSPGQVLDI